MVSAQSFEESVVLFDSESDQLQNILNVIGNKSESLLIHEIIQLYYQIMKVSSLGRQLEHYPEIPDGAKDDLVLKKIHNVQNKISTEFDQKLHPLILSQLITSIQKSTDSLKKLGNDPAKKSKETIESEAKLYKDLRELMSTKEFVEQYQNGLKDD